MKKDKLFCALSAIGGLSLAALYTVCNIKYVNPENLYVEDCVFARVCAVLCAVFGILLFILPFVFLRKKAAGKGGIRSTSATIFSSALLGFLFGGYLVNELLSSPRPYEGFGGMPYIGTIMTVLYYVCLVLCVPCAVYFILLALGKKNGGNVGMTLLSISPVIWFACRLVFNFIKTGANVNIFARRPGIAAISLCVIYFLCEARVSLPGAGTPETDPASASVLYRASGFSAAALLIAFTVPTTLCRALRLFDAAKFYGGGDSYLTSALLIVTAIFILTRLSAFSDSAKEEPEESA